MKNLIILLFLSAIVLSGCKNLMTRTEEDVFTITVMDTTNLYEQKNAPGNHDNGVIFPSSRTITSKRVLVQKDSLVERRYPDFIRLGLFESVGIIGGQSDSALGTGLFGLFPDFSKLSRDYRGESHLFSGGIYRVMTGEWRMRWFGDAKNWTLGTSLWEEIVPDAHFERHFGSLLPVYVRKRWYLSDKIPYLCLTGALGIGYFPSQYLNASVSLDFGSIGGFNMRAYGGFAAAYNGKGNFFVRNSPNPNVSQMVILPYLGLGVSFLDFHNTVDETYVEWKDHEHSAWNVGFAQFSMLYTTADTALGSDGTSKSFIKGMMLRVLNTSLALPFANNRFYAGVSLANLLVMGQNSWGMAIMPLRVGYWALLLPHELSTEPFLEFGIYPTTYFHIGNRLNLKFSDMLNIGLVLGYVHGSTNNGFGKDMTDMFGTTGDMSQFYFGVSLGLFDRIFNEKDLRY
jgi:hypothetical protein